MAKLEITIDKDVYAGLEDSLKQFYTANGDAYELEGIGAVKRAHDADKTRLGLFSGLNPEEAKKAVETMKSLGADADPEVLKKALATQKSAEANKLIDKGKFDEALALKQTEYDNQLSLLKNELDTYKTGYGTRELALKLIEKGVLGDRVEFAQMKLGGLVETVIEDGKPTLKIRDGIGDVKDLDALVESLKTTSSFLFAAEGASGSGASGSQGAGGATKQLSRQAFGALPPAQQSEFSIGGGQITD